MRLSALVSLLATGLIAFVKSEKNTGIPSTFPEILKRFTARRDELLQLSKDQIAKRFLTQFQAAGTNPRELQTSAPSGGGLCNADGSLNVVDDYTQFLFKGDFETSCSCFEDSNEQEVQDKIFALDPTNFTTYAQVFNALFGTVFSSTEYMCQNACETCYDGVCATLSTMQTSFMDYTQTNFTAEDFRSGTWDVSPFTMNFSVSDIECVQYTSGTSFDGKLCFGFDYNATQVSSTDSPCTLEYNDVACNSCIFPADTDLDCYIADCTNIDASAMIDSCNKSGFVGPFLFWGLLVIENITSIPLTVGTCDGFSAPTSPIVPTSVDVPVTAPVTPTPIDGPVSTAPSSPTSVVVPETAPIAPSSPTAPATAPIAPTSGTAPVKAPVKSPIVTTPTAPVTSGSSFFGLSMKLLVFGLGMTVTHFV